MIIFEVNQRTGRKVSLKKWQGWFKKIEKIIKLKKNSEISVAIIGDKEMAKLNWRYRGKKGTTDVLSFREKESRLKLKADMYLGEIIISYPQAKRQAKEMGHSIEKELEILVIHGFLHLLGYDHEKSQKAAEKMKLLAEKILKYRL